jgi:4-amino-4-deoxy-L-arabinose transferase-like glycosyltransferase
LRREVPIAVTFVAGILFLLDYFVKIPYLSEHVVGNFLDWAIVIAAFALLLGAANLLRIHIPKIIKRKKEWYNSVILLVAMVVMAIVPIIWTQQNAVYEYLFNNIFVHLNGTMFALLAFYIASAAYRAFRIRTKEATILLISAVVVMLGRTPVGAQIWKGFPEYANWLQTVFTTAGMRGIMIGASLGAIITALRIIFGIDRSYFGSQ